jgi:hypothetical protein
VRQRAPAAGRTPKPVWSFHADGQSGALLPCQAWMPPLHGAEPPQPRPHRPLDVIVVCPWVAEVGQQPIAEILGDVACLGLAHLGRGFWRRCRA